MIQLSKKKNKIKNKIFFQSSIGNIQIFFIDSTFKIPNNVQIKIQDQTIFFEGLLGKLSFISIPIECAKCVFPKPTPP